MNYLCCSFVTDFCLTTLLLVDVTCVLLICLSLQLLHFWYAMQSGLGYVHCTFGEKVYYSLLGGKFSL